MAQGKGKSAARNGASKEAIVKAAPSDMDRIAQLEEQLANSQNAVAQLSEQLNNTSVDLAIMRDRYTDEINAGNKVRAELMKTQQILAQLQQGQSKSVN